MRTFMLRRRNVLACVFSVLFAAIAAPTSPAQTSPPAASRLPRLLEPVPPVSPIAAGVAVLIVDPPSGGNVMDSDALLQRRINTHAATIASEQHLRKVIGQAEGETRKTHWFKESDSPLERAEWLRDHLRVAVIPGTALIQVSLPDVADPAERMAIVHGICQVYLDNQRFLNTNDYLDRTRVLNTIRIKTEARLKELRADMREKAIHLNLEGGTIGGVGARLGVRDMELSKLVQEQVEAQLNLGKTQSIYKATADAIQQGQDPPQMDARMQRSNPFLQQDKYQLQQIETERDLLAEQNGPNDAKLKAMTQRVEKMRSAYQKQLEEARARTRTAILEESQQEAAAAEAKLKGITARVENLKQDLGELSNSLVQYNTLQQEERGLVEQLKQVKDQIENITAHQSSAAVVEIRWHLYPELTPQR